MNNTFSIKRWLIGNPLATSQAAHERIGKAKSLAVFSSNALSSVAYATEEILLALTLAGAGAAYLSLPIAITIALLLAIVAMSYYQTVHAYPNGGGSYIVALDNLGEIPGLVAAAALLIDYVLTVSVSTNPRSKILMSYGLVLILVLFVWGSAIIDLGQLGRASEAIAQENFNLRQVRAGRVQQSGGRQRSGLGHLQGDRQSARRRHLG